ncbi:hypothetical protein TKK_0018387 [Trichogramma kaykai]
MDDAVVLKMDAIKLSGKRPTRTKGMSALGELERRLRKFFNEADGHGTFYRVPPTAMITPKYFAGSLAKRAWSDLRWIGTLAGQQQSLCKEKLHRSKEMVREKAAKFAERTRVQLAQAQRRASLKKS